MVKRMHQMPFGPQDVGNGRYRFRLWAPSCRKVDLCLFQADSETLLPMHPVPGGWHQREAEASPEGLYAYRIDEELRVPDPASRFQPQDVHGPSQLVDITGWSWTDDRWTGRPWEETVLYELHVGTFSPEGTYAGVEQRLAHLVALGITAIELMPVSDFPGKRNWGYDGVLPFAPDASYGKPEDLKRLVQACHHRGIMVFMDVVYNHFGPEGNYLHAYCPEFFNKRHETPWGAAINFDADPTGTVREFFIQNALYWLEEYHLDGLRFDAVHAIADDSSPHILEEIAERVNSGPGLHRHIHLVLENDHNESRFLARKGTGQPEFYVAQWNDDIHHALHVLGTGEVGGYYKDYAKDPLGQLGRCLTEGFAYQNDPSPYRNGALRGEPSAHLPLSAFVSFIQNHDQVGNRAFGERISALAPQEVLRSLTAVMLLAPSPPLLFMGQEWGADQPFLFFCDFGDDLRHAVAEGRRREFARFPEFADPRVRERIPDPVETATFKASVLEWDALNREPHLSWFRFHQHLLALRRQEIIPRLTGMRAGLAKRRLYRHRLLCVQWTLGDGAVLHLMANLGPAPGEPVKRPAGRLIFGPEASADTLSPAPWTVQVFVEEAR